MQRDRCGSLSSFPTRMENSIYPDARKAEVEDRRRVIRAPTPPRSGTKEEQRQVLWMVFSEGRCVRADLVAMTDAVELEIFAGTDLRRVLRFLRDSGARNYAARLRTKLDGWGFRERRKTERVFWPK
jgi:hypothetical protein